MSGRALWIVAAVVTLVLAFAVVAGGFFWPRPQFERGPWASPSRQSDAPGSSSSRPAALDSAIVGSPPRPSPPAEPGSEGRTREPASAEIAGLPGLPAGEPLPDLALPDLAGRERPIRATPGEVTLINFWATWCIPCLEEIPVLVELQSKWSARGLSVVGIAVDSGKPSDIEAFASEHAMEYQLLVTRQGWALRHFGVFGLPVTLIVDREGTVRRRLIGPQTREQFNAVLRAYL